MITSLRTSTIAVSLIALAACGGESARGRGPNAACPNVSATSGDMPGRRHGGPMGEDGRGGGPEREGRGPGRGGPEGPGMMHGGMMGGGGMMHGGGMMGGGMMGGPRSGPPGAGGRDPRAALAPLSDETKKAVDAALKSELDAAELYRRIAEQFKRPFRTLSFAEQRHAWALENVYESRGLEAPKVIASASKEAPFKDLKAACAAGVTAEKANIALYDDAMKKDLPPDVRRVFSHLRAASEQRHLVAFQRCD